MQNPLKKKIISLFAILILFSTSFSLATEVNSPLLVENSDFAEMELVKNDIRVNDLDVEPLNTENLKKEVIPDTKSEGKKVIQYFLKVMSAVAVCTIVLYIILVLIRRYYDSAFVVEEKDEYEDLSLSTPQTKEDALKSFISRTR